MAFLSSCAQCWLSGATFPGESEPSASFPQAQRLGWCGAEPEAPAVGKAVHFTAAKRRKGAAAAALIDLPQRAERARGLHLDLQRARQHDTAMKNRKEPNRGTRACSFSHTAQPPPFCPFAPITARADTSFLCRQPAPCRLGVVSISRAAFRVPSRSTSHT